MTQAQRSALLLADGGRLCGAQSPSAEHQITIVDDFGVRRTLTKCADCDCYEGVHDTGAGPEPYWLPGAVVEGWRTIAVAGAP